MQPSYTAESTQPKGQIIQWLLVALMIYLLLVAVGMIGSGFKWASGGAEGARQLFAFATNPVMGLVAGALATAVVQSSSTVTSVIVGLVAGGLPVATAIPMIMGANIGTTVTNTLVSMGHIGKKKEFRRAFSAATVHDFFNLMAVMIFLPLEIMTGFLAKSSDFLAGLLVGGDSVSIKGLNFVKVLTGPAVDLFKGAYGSLPDLWAGVCLALTGLAFIFISIIYLGKLLKHLMVGKAKQILHKAIGRGPATGIFSGMMMTIAVQSSSTCTSLIVPLAGNGIFKLREVYPFTLGANIGTTITALLAATAVQGAMGFFALQIALVHLLFNVSAVLLIYIVPFLRNIPPTVARRFAQAASRKKWMVLAYVVGVFFILPAILIAITA
ncbi:MULTISPECIES: Na/Pi symporter [Gammaproteobacteria]|uniref:Na/Pi symporter n=1 Tax=Gammaproteobacteria TaxID=1236 RepID=UPI001ADA38C3|nr:MULTISPECIES: Na/Pi symporter [Gammaproteobacteria]MBO9481321.1 Na/Pi symporter [Salinisphaera sp. G21_0]MBO9492514.1 Na/Pi symporter [Thalassotalea sp. G20_0]